MSFNHWPGGKPGAALLIAGLAFAGAGPSASAQGARPELAFVSRDAFFFLQARPAQLWKGEVGGALRKEFEQPAGMLGMAGQAMLGAAPEEIDTIILAGQTVRSVESFLGFAGKPKMTPPAKEFKKFEEKGIDAPPPKRGEKPVPEKGFGPKEKEVGFQDKKEIGDPFQDKKEFGPLPFGPGGEDWKDKGAAEMPSAAVKVITTTKPYDRDKVAAALLRGEKLERTINGKKYLVSSKSYPWAVHFVNDRTYVIASPPAWMEKLLLGPARAKGGLESAVALAGKKHDLVIGFNWTEPSALEAKKVIARGMFDPWRREPGWVIAPLLAMQTAAFALDIGKESTLQARLTFPNAGKAEQAEAAAADAIALVRIFMLGRARQELRREIEDAPNPTVPMFISLLIKQFEDGMHGVKVIRKGAELSASAEAKIDIAAIKSRTKAEADAILADEAGRLARNRRVSVNNLKQLALAIQSFHDGNRMLPPPAICSKKDGTPLLSWRVMMLPYIDENPLHSEFKLDEPWDSAHNIKLLPRMPKIYAGPGVKTKGEGMTFYQVLVGPDTAFPMMPDKNREFGASNRTLIGITDGTSNTFGVVEAHSPVPWTKPEDLPYDAKKAVPKMGGTIMPNGFNAAFLDGTVRFINSRMDEKNLRGLITANGGEAVRLPFDDD